MNEHKFEISVNQEDVQNIINCYEKDIKYIEQLENRINKCVERIENTLKTYPENCFTLNPNVTYLNILLNILRGENNE